MNIAEKLKFIETFHLLDQILENAHTEVNWGQRRVYVIGYDRYTSPGSLAECLQKILGKNLDFDEEERKSGKSAAQKIHEFYISTDQTINKSHVCFLLNKISEYYNPSGLTRFFFPEAFAILESYSENQWKKYCANKEPVGYISLGQTSRIYVDYPSVNCIADAGVF